MPLFASLASFGLALLVITAILSEITTLVGSGGAGFFDGSVQFNNPYGVAVDSEGNVYIGDGSNRRIRKITPAGVVTTFAGRGSGASADGTGTNAQFSDTRGIAFDSLGNLYVAEQTTHLIRKITPAGVVTTFAGSGQSFPFTDGTGTNATFTGPTGVTVDSLGNVYVADQTNHRIRRITPAGVVTTVAGNGSSVFADGVGTNAQFYSPTGVTVDSVGNVYVADFNNHRIRKITSERVTTLAGSGVNGSANGTGTNASFAGVISSTVDLIGNVYIADQFNHRIRKITSSGVMTTLAGSGTTGSADGTGTNASFNRPVGITVDSVGNLYVTESTTNAHRIRRIVPELVSTFATDLYQVSSITVDSLGNVYSVASSRIYKTTPAGVSTVFAGDGSQAFQDGTGTSARFWNPQGLACDSAGNVYLADNGNHRIRRITPEGVVTTLAGSTQGFQDGTGTNATFSDPRGVAVDSAGIVYVVEQTNNRIRRITPEGVVTTLAGSGTIGSADGTGTNATFSTPYAVAVDSVGNVYVADLNNGCIRKITPAGVVTTLAGGGFGNFNDGAGTNASFNNLRGLIVDSVGNVYVSEVGNHRIRRITPEGVVSTFAGTGQDSPRTDGATSLATFNQPNAVALDSVGNIYVSEFGNNCIRKITLESTVTTLAGSTSSGSTDGTGTNASFYGPTGIAVDSGGVVYVADAANQRIRKIATDIVTTFAGSTYGRTNGTGTNAQFVTPKGMALDSLGNLYVADQNANRICKITSSGVMTTFAGQNNPGSADGTGTNASFNQPNGVAVDSTGNVYVADTTNQRIRKITPAGVVTTLAGSTQGYLDGTGTNAIFSVPSGIAVDSAGNVYVGDQYNNCIRKITPGGVVTTLPGKGANIFVSPSGVAVDSAGNVYTMNVTGSQIIKITPEGVITTLAGNGNQGYADGTGTNASFNRPRGITLDSTGNLYVADNFNQRIRKITPGGVVTTLIGNGNKTFANGIPSNTSFTEPYGIAVTSDGTIYVSDDVRIRKITFGGNVVTTLAGSTQGSLNGVGTLAQFWNPSGVAVDSTGIVYVADNLNNLIRKITSPGVTTLAGSTPGFLNGTGSAAQFYTPHGVAVDSAGNVYVADYNNQRIRKITSTGVVTTLAGSGTPTNIDGTGTSATFFNPVGVAVDSTGFVYVAQSSNVIRMITPEGVVRTIAGNGPTGAFLDGVGTNARFSGSAGITVDSAGNVYIADSDNHRIRKIAIDYVTTFAGNGSGISDPYGVAVDSAGNIYVTMQFFIKKITPGGVVTILAGLSAGYGSVDGTGTSATFDLPRGIAVDSAGNVYVSERGGNRIRKITSGGVVTTLAGNGTYGYLDGTGTNATFSNTRGVAVDSAGNVYVADYNNNRIRKITPEGVVTTLAGQQSTGSTNGTGTNASFNGPNGVAVDSAGNVYVSDLINTLIRKITPSGVVTTFAGSSYGSVDGTGTNAAFTYPEGITLDSVGNLYVSEQSHRIRRITPAGVVTTLAGNGTPGYLDGPALNSIFSSPQGLVVDLAGSVYVADLGNGCIRKITFGGNVVTTFAGQANPGSTDGTGTSARFNGPYKITFDSVGNLYVADNNNHRIRKITPGGVVSTFAGSTQGYLDGTGTNAQFNFPSGLELDSSGNLYVADSTNNRIRRITPAGVVSTLSGNGSVGSENTTLLSSSFSSPRDLAVDSDGNVYVADTNNNRIRKIVETTLVSTLAGGSPFGSQDGTGTSARFYGPYGIAVDSAGTVYVAETSNRRVRRITPGGVVTTLAGNGNNATTDGIGTAASFSLPFGVAVDSIGSVYVANVNLIRKIPVPVVSTIAGSVTAGFADGLRTSAQFNNPSGIAVDSAGTIYVTEWNGHRIRKITSAGLVTTLAGSGMQGYADGIGFNATFFNPAGIAVDSAGIAYVAEWSNNRIRKISPAGLVTTMAGSSASGFANSEQPVQFDTPQGVAMDSIGNLYVSGGNYRIRKITSTGVVSTFLNGSLTNPSFGTVVGMVIDSVGNLYLGNGHNILKITPAGVVTTLAGSTTPEYLDGTGTNARFNSADGLAIDSAGNLYVADRWNLRIRKITPGGVVTTFAGNATAQLLNGTGTNASFNYPWGLVIDSDGNLYVGDSNNHCIRKITPDGVVTTLAGNGSSGTADGTGTNARFWNPYGLAIDSAKNLYVWDNYWSRIRKVTSTGVVTTLAGSSQGFLNGQGTNALFNNSSGGLAVDSLGNVYIAESGNHRIRKITPEGVVTTFAGSTQGYSDGGWFNQPVGVATDWDGTVYVADTQNHRIRKITPAGAVTTLAGFGTTGSANGTGTSAQFNFPRGVALDSTLNLYVADSASRQIRRITPAGVVTFFAGSTSSGFADGTGTSATFNTPVGITVDRLGTVYVSDIGNHNIRRITAAGVVTSFAGSRTATFADGVGTNASFNTPSGIVADIYGNVYVADTNNHRIRRITSDGTVTTLAGTTAGFKDGVGTSVQFNFPYHLSIDALGTLYVADQTNNCIRTVQTSTGVVSTLAGTGLAGFTPSRFNTPQGINVDRFRNAYVGDTGNHSIRKIPNVYTVPENNGVVTTFAGEGVGGFLDGMGIGARFNQPAGVAIDSMGTLYIADQGQHRIRRITPAGVVTVFAGSTTIGATNGTGTNATFSNPRGVAVDSAGNVYVADSNNNRIRRITSTGVVTTFAGSGTPAFLDGTGTNASFQFPTAIAVDSFGNVFVADQSNHRIRRITPAGVVTTLAGGGTGTFVNGTGTNAAFNSPTGIAVDSFGNVYVGDQSNHRIRRITPEGVVTTLAGATQGFQDGTGTNASFYQPNGIAVDSAGFVYVTDYLNHRIRKITSAGVVTTLAGSGIGQGTNAGSFSNGTGTNASFGGPYAVAVDSAGNLYVAEWSNNRIRKIGSGVPQLPLNRAVVTTFAGTSFTGFSDGTGTNARFLIIGGLAVNSLGTIYVSDTNNQRIRAITPAGVVTTLAGQTNFGSADGTGASASFRNPQGIAVDSAGNVYVADSNNNRIRRITPGGVVTTLAGGTEGGYLDGTGTNVQLNSPYGIAVDSAGTVYVGEAFNHRIRKITPAGVVSTLAGSGTGMGQQFGGVFADGTGTNASFNSPQGIALDSVGNVYVADTYNHRIRKITPAGVVTTLAGSEAYAYADGIGTNAAFSSPIGITIDSVGDMYIADAGNKRIRKMTPAGVVTTFAGSVPVPYQMDGIGTNATFDGPSTITINSAGTLYVAANSIIRKIQ